MISIKFYNEKDEHIASCDASQVPLERSNVQVSVDGVPTIFRVLRVEWKVQAGLHASVFLK